MEERGEGEGEEEGIEIGTDRNRVQMCCVQTWTLQCTYHIENCVPQNLVRLCKTLEAL